MERVRLNEGVVSCLRGLYADVSVSANVVLIAIPFGCDEEGHIAKYVSQRVIEEGQKDEEEDVEETELEPEEIEKEVEGVFC